MKNNDTKVATYIQSKEVETNHIGNYMPGIYVTKCIGNQSVQTSTLNIVQRDLFTTSNWIRSLDGV